MVVRERRRIASLAKTASSLDEQLQAVQKDNEAKEVAFRSYVQDSQQDFANLSMNHQEQILSLMSLVKDGDNSQSGDENDAAISTSLSSEFLSMDAKQTSKLLILANERISCLEQQLRELKAEKKVSEAYRLEKEELQTALEAKAEECEKVEIRLSGVRSALRQIRDTLSDDFKEIDATESSSGSDPRKKCLLIIKEALLVSPGPLSPLARRHSCPNVLVGGHSPRSAKEWSFVQAADDEDDDEEDAPEWADEIMADLAFIAEGQLPPSLMDVPEISEHEAELGSSDADIRDEKKTVFERLADPVCHTGIQKAKSSSSEGKPPSKSPSHAGAKNLSSPERPSKAERPSSVPQPSPTRIAQSRAIKESQSTSTSSVEAEPAATSDSTSNADSTKSNASQESADRSVFDRLLSPSSFTGTQKEKLQAQNGPPSKEKQLNRAESAADRLAEKMLNDLLQNDEDAFRTRSGEPSSKVNEYTQQNVFERLQKTTTQSFDVKHAPDPGLNEQPHEATHPPGAPNSLKHENGHVQGKGAKSSTETKTKKTVPPAPELPYSTSPDYSSLPVFERLQKTTTQSFAVKHAPNLDSQDPHHEANASQPSGPPKQDVKGPRAAMETRTKRIVPGASQSSSTEEPSRYKSPLRARNRSRGTVKKSWSSDASPSKVHVSSKSPSRTRPDKDEYTQQNVFERLTRTTTEAYAVKQRNQKG
jgi:hypothetical protein